MEVTELLTSISPDQQFSLRVFLEAHPRVYLMESSGLRSGLTPYHEWRVVDPDQSYKTIAVGKSPHDAVRQAVYDWENDPEC